MPFLVDSVTMELNEQNREVHMVVHPQILVRRDMTGKLEEILAGDDQQADRADADLSHDVFRESWMHIEIGRESSAEQREEIERALAKVLQDVREAVEDWPKMHQQALDIIDDLEEHPPPLPAEEIAEGQALLRWLADTHFTFLGYREYQLEDVGDGSDDVALRAVPGTGFGILRSDQDMSASFAKLPPLVRAKAREKTLLVLAKANSKATVHRPVYLDYVGVKTFDESGEVVGERRFLGLFSSAAYTESLTRIPVIRVKAKQVIDRAGFAPLSHSRQGADGRARDLPARRAVPDPDRRAEPDRGVGAAHPGAPPGPAVRAPGHLRALPVVPGVPAPRPLQHRGARAHRRDPQDPARAASRWSTPHG